CQIYAAREGNHSASAYAPSMLKIIFRAFCAIVLPCTFASAQAAPGRLSVSIMESPEHGLAIVMQTPGGKTYLIDSGHESNDYNAGRDTILPHLQKLGVTEIAGIALSHAHGDH